MRTAIVTNENGAPYMTSVIKGKLVMVDCKGPRYLGLMDTNGLIRPFAQMVEQSLANLANNPDTLVAWRCTDDELESGFAEEQVMLKLAGYSGVGDLQAKFDEYDKDDHLVNMEGVTLLISNEKQSELIDILVLLYRETNRWITMHIKTRRDQYNPRREHE